jgi:hypothetical protein
MLTLASAILAITPLMSPALPANHAGGEFPALRPIWGKQSIVERDPYVQLWLSGDNLFKRGQGADVYYRTDEDAYVLIIRIDTDGRMEMLSPDHPNGYQFARGGETYHVSGSPHQSFRIDDDPGLGYVFAIASWDPFEFDRVALSRYGGYRFSGYRVHGDPFVTVQELADQLVNNRYPYYALSHLVYYVERRVEYPRFLCYDCHGYRSYASWNPYAYRCLNFRVVIYDDPYYYPYRYGRGSRVVYVRDTRRPRYEFKSVSSRGSDQGPFIEHRNRPDNVDTRRPTSSASASPIGPRGGSTAGAGAGATRPGDEVRSNGGRRVIGSTAPGDLGPENRLPRREDASDGGETRGPRRGDSGDDGGVDRTRRGESGVGTRTPQTGAGAPGERTPRREDAERLPERRSVETPRVLTREPERTTVPPRGDVREPERVERRDPPQRTESREPERVERRDPPQRTESREPERVERRDPPQRTQTREPERVERRAPPQRTQSRPPSRVERRDPPSSRPVTQQRSSTSSSRRPVEHRRPPA